MARKRLGWSQGELGDHLGVRQATVSTWERGRSLPDAGNLVGLCAVLAVSPQWLLGLPEIEDLEDAALRAAEVAEVRTTLDRVRRRLEEALRVLEGVERPIDRQALLLFRAEALRQDSDLAARYGPLAWLAVADSMAREWVRAGVLEEEDLGLWWEWRDVARGGEELPPVSWRELGLSREGLLRLGEEA